MHGVGKRDSRLIRQGRWQMDFASQSGVEGFYLLFKKKPSEQSPSHLHSGQQWTELNLTPNIDEEIF